jgi:hypothetical protein
MKIRDVRFLYLAGQGLASLGKFNGFYWDFIETSRFGVRYHLASISIFFLSSVVHYHHLFSLLG